MRDLINRCLSVVPTDRPSLEDILMHPWMLDSCEQLDKKLSQKTNVPGSAADGESSHQSKTTRDDVTEFRTRLEHMTAAETLGTNRCCDCVDTSAVSSDPSQRLLDAAIQLCAESSADTCVELCGESSSTDKCVELCTESLTDRCIELCSESSTDRCVELCGESSSTDNCVELCAESSTDRCVELCGESSSDRHVEPCVESSVTDRCVEVCTKSLADRCVELCVESSTDRCVELFSESSVDRCVELCSESAMDRCSELCGKSSADRRVELSSVDRCVELCADLLCEKTVELYGTAPSSDSSNVDQLSVDDSAHTVCSLASDQSQPAELCAMSSSSSSPVTELKVPNASTVRDGCCVDTSTVVSRPGVSHSKADIVTEDDSDVSTAVSLHCESDDHLCTQSVRPS